MIGKAPKADEDNYHSRSRAGSFSLTGKTIEERGRRILSRSGADAYSLTGMQLEKEGLDEYIYRPDTKPRVSLGGRSHRFSPAYVPGSLPAETTLSTRLPSEHIMS